MIRVHPLLLATQEYDSDLGSGFATVSHTVRYSRPVTDVFQVKKIHLARMQPSPLCVCVCVCVRAVKSILGNRMFSGVLSVYSCA